MINSEIQTLINRLGLQTAAGSISPSMVATILGKLLEAIPEGGTAPSTPSASHQECIFGTLAPLVSVATTEQTMKFDTISFKSQDTVLAQFHTKGDDGPLLTAKQACLVEVQGFVTMRATDSYTADRILRWFRLDEEGERYDGAVITTHFTGTTQIFSVPVSFSVKMDAGDTLNLVHYSSTGSTNISANSSLFIKVTPFSE